MEPNPFRRLARIYKQAFSENRQSHIWLQVPCSTSRSCAHNLAIPWTGMLLHHAGRRPGYALLVKAGNGAFSRTAVGLSANYWPNWVSFVSNS